MPSSFRLPYLWEKILTVQLIYAPHYFIDIYKITPQPPTLQGEREKIKADVTRMHKVKAKYHKCWGSEIKTESSGISHRSHRNPTVQKEAIRPIESAPTTIPPRPYPHIPTYLPTNPSNLRISGH